MKLVRVTSKDIRIGERTQCQGCPVWRAIVRALGMDGFPYDEMQVEVYSTEVHISNAALAYRKILFPPHVRRFIFAFDACKFVRPIEFWMMA